MSFINSSPLAGMNGNHQFAYEPTQNETTQNDLMRPSQIGFNEGFRPTPISLPIDTPGNGYSNGSGASASGSSDANSFFSGIMQTLSNLMSQIAGLFGQSGASASNYGNGYASTGSQFQPQENAYTSATASSTGDPHEAFNGTTSTGVNQSGKWDSMKSHSDLLDSDSFRGGYQVSTTTTTPNSSGVTLNASATVTTHNGNDAVTLNNDGSYSVTENGQNVALTQGQATQIGRNETVTLNADNSLTIVDTNHQGGSLTTTLSKNGNGGVDVNASGSNVDLGGYLVNKTDQQAPPVAYQPYQTPYQSPYAAAYGSNLLSTQTAGFDTYGYGNETEPLGAGEIEFA